jgi:hypothetical protein
VPAAHVCQLQPRTIGQAEDDPVHPMPNRLSQGMPAGWGRDQDKLSDRLSSPLFRSGEGPHTVSDARTNHVYIHFPCVIVLEWFLGRFEFFWKCFGSVLEVYWKCIGSVLEVYWKCIGSVWKCLEVYWKCMGSVWKCIKLSCVCGGEIARHFVAVAGADNQFHLTSLPILASVLVSSVVIGGGKGF